MVDWGDLKKWYAKQEKSNHDHKRGLGCILGLLLKRYHNTSKLVQIVYHPTCTLSEIIEQWNIYIKTPTHYQNIGAVHSDKHIYKI